MKEEINEMEKKKSSHKFEERFTLNVIIFIRCAETTNLSPK